MPSPRRLPRPAAPLLVLVTAASALFRRAPLAGALIAGSAAFWACNGADGETPSCTPNVTMNGIQNVDNGCEQFPPCVDDKGNTQKSAAGVAATCCADAGDTAGCLYAYGVGPAPTGAGGAAAGSSSSGGMGGKGGGP